MAHPPNPMPAHVTDTQLAEIAAEAVALRCELDDSNARHSPQWKTGQARLSFLVAWIWQILDYRKQAQRIRAESPRTKTGEPK